MTIYSAKIYVDIDAQSKDEAEEVAKKLTKDFGRSAKPNISAEIHSIKPKYDHSNCEYTALHNVMPFLSACGPSLINSAAYEINRLKNELYVLEHPNFIEIDLSKCKSNYIPEFSANNYYLALVPAIKNYVTNYDNIPRLKLGKFYFGHNHYKPKPKEIYRLISSDESYFPFFPEEWLRLWQLSFAEIKMAQLLK